MIGFQCKMAKAMLHIMSVKNKARKALPKNIEMESIVNWSCSYSDTCITVL